MTGLPDLPKGGSVIAPAMSAPKPKLMTRSEFNKLEAYKPWADGCYGDCYRNWFEWMRSRDCSFVGRLSASDAVAIYTVMVNMAWDCHNKHPFVKQCVQEEKS